MTKGADEATPLISLMLIFTCSRFLHHRILSDDKLADIDKDGGVPDVIPFAPDFFWDVRRSLACTRHSVGMQGWYIESHHVNNLTPVAKFSRPQLGMLKHSRILIP